MNRKLRADDFGRKDIVYHSAEEEPFVIHGVKKENGLFRRIPEQVAGSVSEGVRILHTNTAGGRIRFRTDSPYFAVYAKIPSLTAMPHFALTGSAGFDLYLNGVFSGVFMPDPGKKDRISAIIDRGEDGVRDVTVNMPLYNDVSEVYIGLREGCELLPPLPYRHEKPVVFYGSSITQGGCASRPGMSYQAILSRRFGSDYINLGFSGSAKGEDEMAEYIAGLDMSVFVLDYDHNAPDPEHLRNTHAKFFRTVRNAHPDIPILMMSRPVHHLSPDEYERLEIIKTTFYSAVSEGDKNVYLLDGPALTAHGGQECTVDGTHPTDLGFYSMAEAVGKVFREIGF